MTPLALNCHYEALRSNVDCRNPDCFANPPLDSFILFVTRQQVPSAEHEGEVSFNSQTGSATPPTRQTGWRNPTGWRLAGPQPPGPDLETRSHGTHPWPMPPGSGDLQTGMLARSTPAAPTPHPAQRRETLGSSRTGWPARLFWPERRPANPTRR